MSVDFLQACYDVCGMPGKLIRKPIFVLKLLLRMVYTAVFIITTGQSNVQKVNTAMLYYPFKYSYLYIDLVLDNSVLHSTAMPYSSGGGEEEKKKRRRKK